MANRFQSTTREVKLQVSIEGADAEAQSAASAISKLQQVAGQTENAVNRVGAASSLITGRAQQAQSALQVLGANQGIAAGIAVNLSAAKGLLNTIGSPGLAAGAEVIESAGKAIAILPSLSESVKNIPTLINDVAKGFGTSGVGLVGALGGVGIAVTAFGVALNQVASVIEEGKRQVSDAVNGLREYFRLVEFGTTEQIQAKIDELEQQRVVAQLALEVARNSREYAQAQFDNADLLNKGLILASGVFGQLNSEIAKLEAETAETTRQINALKQALPRVAERTAEIVEGLADLIAANERSAQIELQTQLQISQMTADRARERIQQIQSEMQITGALIEQGRFSGDALTRLQERMSALALESGFLQEALSGVLAERERETNLLEASKKLLSERAKIEQEIAQLQKQRADAEQSLGEAIQKGLEIQAKANADLAQLEIDKNEQIQQAQTDAADQLLKLQVQNAKAREKVEKDFARASSNAIASRDALAFLLAKQARDDQLDNLSDQYAEQEQTISDSLNKQLASIESNYNKQLKAIQDKLTADIQAQQQEIARRRQALAQINSELNQALQQEQFLRNAYLTLNQQALQTAFQNMYQQVVTFGNNAVVALQSAFQQALAPPPMLPPLQPLAPISGVVGSSGSSSAPLLVGAPRDAITINVQGATERRVSATSRREAMQVFDRVLSDIMVD